MHKHDVMRKVQALISKADSTEFSGERDALLEKADSMMLAYAIESWELEAAKPAKQRTKPEQKKIPVCYAGSLLWQQLADLTSQVAKHCRCRHVFHGLRGNGQTTITASLVGFSSDLEYAELLLTSLHLQLARELEPHPDPKLSIGENVAVLKEAGLKWDRIWELIFPGEGKFDRRYGGRLIGPYKKFCADTGRTQIKVQPITYQRNFATGFVDKVALRLEQIRKVQDSSGQSNALVLHDRGNEVADMMRELFPHLTFHKHTEGKYNSAARMAGNLAGARADLSGGSSSIKNNPREIGG